MLAESAKSSKNPQTLILGSNGYVGSRILSVGTARHVPLCVSRITNENDLLRFEQEVQHAIGMHPDAALVNCLGVRSSSRKNMELLNVRVPETLVKVLQKSEMRLIHFGSAAEIVEVIPKAESTSIAVPPQSLLYSQTKRRGTQIALSHKDAVVLRLYNLHGLPHQTDSGLHQLCLRIRSSLNNP
jgi:nucleoside-diphosphate-sugar epimerase